MPKKLLGYVSEHFWTVNMLKGPKHCWRLHGSTFVINFWSLWKSFCSRNSVTAASRILRLFVNLLTSNDKYSLSVKVSIKRKKFKRNYLINLKHFLDILLRYSDLHNISNIWKKKKKDEPHTWCISEIIHGKKRGYFNF